MRAVKNRETESLMRWWLAGEEQGMAHEASSRVDITILQQSQRDSLTGAEVIGKPASAGADEWGSASRRHAGEKRSAGLTRGYPKTRFAGIEV